MKKSLLIAFSGIDGAGKSTQIKMLSEYMRSKGDKVFVTEKMFGYFLLKPVIGFLRNVTGSLPAGPVKRNKRNSLLKLWFIPAFIDIWLGYIFKVRPVVNKYDYVIADRFYTDIWANLLYYGYLPHWAFKFFIKFLPKPDIAIMLSVKPETVLRREMEFQADYYYEQEKIYENLSKSASYCVVDANGKPKEVFKQIEKYLN